MERQLAERHELRGWPERVFLRQSGEHGREVRYVQMSPEQFTAALTEQGLPPDLTWLLDYLFATVLDGRNASVTEDVQSFSEATGTTRGA